MAMGKAVVVTHSRGQTDVVIDRRAATRSSPPRALPLSLLRTLAEREGVAVERNGLYVPPGDPLALRRAIDYLLDRPDERARLGAAARRAVASLTTVDQFAQRLGAIIERAASAGGAASGGHPEPAAAHRGP
jgi:glycosyltransferase involved in cell wall biosynthesis